MGLIRYSVSLERLTPDDRVKAMNTLNAIGYTGCITLNREKFLFEVDLDESVNPDSVLLPGGLRLTRIS